MILRPERTASAKERGRQQARSRAQRVTSGCRRDRTRAIALFEHVREEIAFGFTRRFDSATADQTLRAGRGHCNPQAELLVTMMRAVGLEARHHFVWLSPDILHGLVPFGLPPQLDHAFVEVRLDGRWIPIDGYILDPALAVAASARLDAEGRTMGYGAHRDGRWQWDGRTPCMAQRVDPSMDLADWGPFPEQREHFDGPHYGQRLGVMGSIGFAFAARHANRVLDELRHGG